MCKPILYLQSNGFKGNCKLNMFFLGFALFFLRKKDRWPISVGTYCYISAAVDQTFILIEEEAAFSVYVCAIL